MRFLREQLKLVPAGVIALFTFLGGVFFCVAVIGVFMALKPEPARIIVVSAPVLPIKPVPKDVEPEVAPAKHIVVNPLPAVESYGVRGIAKLLPGELTTKVSEPVTNPVESTPERKAYLKEASAAILMSPGYKKARADVSNTAFSSLANELDGLLLNADLETAYTKVTQELQKQASVSPELNNVLAEWKQLFEAGKR